eukprot:GILK01007949.1.p1 GENE.GILK01007949.1~~GILK01007949.1.p1  ORF type:complete len:419 (-),score=43.85 GILK01007949.1:215-1471(-)
MTHVDSFSDCITRSSYRSIILILLWYAPSIGLLLFNKWFMHKFPFVFTVTALYFLVTSLLSLLYIRHFNADFRPQSSLYKRIIPIGIVASLETCASNFAVQFLSVTTATVLKSSTPVFLVLFMFCLRVERFSCRLILTVSIISVGVALAVYGEMRAHINGLIASLTSILLSCLRWTLTQKILHDAESRLTPIQLLYLISPVCFLTLLPAMLIQEGSNVLDSALFYAVDSFFEIIALLIFGGVLALCLTVAEYAIVRFSSSITLSIAGIFKEILTIIASGMIFGDSLQPINIIGIAISICGISYYIYYRSMDVHQIAPDLTSLPLELEELDPTAWNTIDELEAESDKERPSDSVAFNNQTFRGYQNTPPPVDNLLHGKTKFKKMKVESTGRVTKSFVDRARGLLPQTKAKFTRLTLSDL